MDQMESMQSDMYTLVDVIVIVLTTLFLCIIIFPMLFRDIHFRLFYYTDPQIIEASLNGSNNVDSIIVPKDVLANRLVWFDNELIRYKYAGYNFDKYGLPVNPHKVTHRKGRGNLERYGANHTFVLVLTRTTENLQILVINRIDFGHPALPSGTMKSDVFSSTIQDALGGEIDDEIKDKINSSEVLYSGYDDDSRCTDTSWIEIGAFHTHLTRNEADKLSFGSNVFVEWYDVELINLKHDPIEPKHCHLVTKVVDKVLNAELESEYGKFS